MANNYRRSWFKFYGQDWLTDGKILRLGVEDRLCYIAILCLASASDEQGVIHGYDEDTIIRLAAIPDAPTLDTNPFDEARGCLKRFEALGMITIHDNEMITVVRFTERQNVALTGYERLKRYRDSHASTPRIKRSRSKIISNDNDNDNAPLHNDNAREEKKRVEKSREDIDKENPKGLRAKPSGIALTKKDMFGDPLIGEAMLVFKARIGGSLDGSQVENRRFAHLLLNRLKKDYPEQNPIDLLRSAIDAAQLDQYFAKNCTSFKWLYYNLQKIIQGVKVVKAQRKGIEL